MIEPKQKKVAELATLNLSGVDGTRTRLVTSDEMTGIGFTQVV
jgi:hypothetical protein